MKDSHYKSMITAMYSITLISTLFCVLLEWDRVTQVNTPTLLATCTVSGIVFFTAVAFFSFFPLFIRACVICLFPALMAALGTSWLIIDSWICCSLITGICCSALSRNTNVLVCAYIAALGCIAAVISVHYLSPDCIQESDGKKFVGLFIYDVIALHFATLVLYFLIISQNKQTVQLNEQRVAAEKAVKVKSDFLANMNHEIRTPLNAILGFSSFLQASTLPPTEHEYALNLRTASQALLSIINDVLDLAKLEAGMFDIVPIQYATGSLLNDLVSTLSIRFSNQPVHFFLDIDPALPQVLVGDEIRIRQIITNLISNALKFTKAGFVRLSIKGVQANEHLLLYVSVQDSGTGIKEIDRKKLFGVFQQIDTHRNRSTEGTGLGLTISRNFVEMMHGTVYVDTKWGSGSTFSFVVPQEFGTSRAPLVQINDRTEGQRRIAILERNGELTGQWDILMKQLKLDFKTTSTPAEYLTMIQSKLFSHYLIAEEFYEKMESDLSDVTVNLIVVIKQTTRLSSDFGLPYLRRPIYCTSLCAALSGNEINTESSAVFQGRFTAPTARILIVDDNEMNIKIAEGLLECYECKMLSVMSGMDAVEAMQSGFFDLVMMDHMMPEMDGVETTKKIRALPGEYYESVPIVAVTANAIAGVQETLMAASFSDFLAKPIEPARLANILMKWLPVEKIVTAKKKEEDAHAESKRILKSSGDSHWKLISVNASEAKIRSGLSVGFNLLDTKVGLRYCGNEKKMYLLLLSDFAAESAQMLQKIKNLYEAKDWKNYAIEVHSLKSISRTFGALSLSEASMEMEHAGKAGDEALITEMFEQYVAIFIETAKHIADYVEKNTGQKNKMR